MRLEARCRGFTGDAGGARQSLDNALEVAMANDDLLEEARVRTELALWEDANGNQMASMEFKETAKELYERCGIPPRARTYVVNA